jgi:outer membrane protein insertion porin family
MILPQLWVPQKYRTDPQEPIAGTDLLFIDGMFNARGWPTIYNGQAMWSNWLEFRMPIVESIVWFDTFFDAATIWFDRDNIGEMGADNMLFGLGAGFRFTIPQFPIRFYLAKRFAIRDGSIRWQPGQFFNNPDRPTSGLDFVFSIGTGLF